MPLYFVSENTFINVSLRVTNDSWRRDDKLIYLPAPTAEPPYFRLPKRVLRSYFEDVLTLTRERGVSSVVAYLPVPLDNGNVYSFLEADLGGLILSYDVNLYIILRDREREILRDIPNDLPDLPLYSMDHARASSTTPPKIRRVRRMDTEDNYSAADDCSADGFLDSSAELSGDLLVCESCESVSPLPPSLVALLENLDEGFALTLLRLIDARGMNDVDVYKKSGVSRQTWYKIMNDRDYRPSKRTVLSFAIALELNLEETHALLATVGFTLSHSLPFDVIVEYFITRGSYDVFAINAVLYSCDLEPLGG